jgi:hypothetical protein
MGVPLKLAAVTSSLELENLKVKQKGNALECFEADPYNSGSTILAAPGQEIVEFDFRDPALQAFPRRFSFDEAEEEYL